MKGIQKRFALSAFAVMCLSLLMTACGNVSSTAAGPSNNQWSWISGSDVTNQSGFYGVQGASTNTTIPGGRENAVSWMDTNGNFWLFGGFGFDSGGTLGQLNDLWKFNGSSWTWENGNPGADTPGVYVISMSTPTTMPGSRNYAVSWTDQSGNFWLFGGYGLASSSTDGELNDLWKFDGSSWTWVSGANVINQNGIYGVEGVPSGTNCPGSRYASASWIDKQGALWLFGGYGYDINGDLGNLNDLWKFDGSNWTWISGANVVDQPGMYGNQGVAQGTNQPGARYGAASWADAGGSFWFFGGAMYSAATGTNDYFNDLWKYDGSNWTLMSGGNTPNQAGVYGSQGTAASTNAPRARSASVSWIDRQGNLWLFGGESFDPVNTTCQLNDMWKYDGVNWTWMTGSDAANQGGVYGQPNTIAPGFIPGAREGAIAWMDNSGNFWLFGGLGFGQLGQIPDASGSLNDTWVYLP